MRRRSSRTVCDSLFCTVAVAAPVALSVAYYRNDLRQLLRLLFLLAVLFAALLTVRHSLGRARQRLKKWLSGGKQDVKEDAFPRPDLDKARGDSLARVQRIHDEKAEDFERRVAGPRRERKLEESEKKMKYIRGFVGEGVAVGGGQSGVSRLLDDQSQSLEDRTRSSDEAHDSHVTSDDVTGGGDQSGKQIWIVVQLPDSRSVRSQFHTSQTIKMVYRWLESEGHRVRHHVLATPHTRQLLNDRGRTLEECGITMDTRLILEEKDD